jgi:hypothetical protein
VRGDGGSQSATRKAVSVKANCTARFPASTNRELIWLPDMDSNIHSRLGRILVIELR